MRSIRLELLLASDPDDDVLCAGDDGAWVPSADTGAALLLSLLVASMARVPGETAEASSVVLTLSSLVGGVSDDVTMSISPTRVDPSLKRTRFLWALRQFCFNSVEFRLEFKSCDGRGLRGRRRRVRKETISLNLHLARRNLFRLCGGGKR